MPEHFWLLRNSVNSSIKWVPTQGPQWTKNQHERSGREIVYSLRSLFLPHKTKGAADNLHKETVQTRRRETTEIYSGPLTNTFELPGSTDTLISFTKSVLHYYRPWMNPEIGKCRYGRPTVKWYRDFQLCRKLALKPLCYSKVNILLICARHHWAPYLFSLLLNFHRTSLHPSTDKWINKVVYLPWSVIWQ